MKYFGTDGFRGEANVGLTVEHAYKIGRFVGWYYGANRERKVRVIVGKDTRRSSYMFEAALVKPTEAALYRLLRRQLPHSIIVSIGHRGTLAEFHDKSMYIARAGCAA